MLYNVPCVLLALNRVGSPRDRTDKQYVLQIFVWWTVENPLPYHWDLREAVMLPIQRAGRTFQHHSVCWDLFWGPCVGEARNWIPWLEKVKSLSVLREGLQPHSARLDGVNHGARFDTDRPEYYPTFTPVAGKGRVHQSLTDCT